MRTRATATFLALGLCVATVVSSEAVVGRPGQRKPGLVVEQLEPGSAPELAGIRPGDLLLSWERRNPGTGEVVASGMLDTPFDLREFSIEHLPLGDTTVRFRRGNELLSAALVPGQWGDMLRTHTPAGSPALRDRELRYGAPGTRVRINLTGNDLRRYESGLALIRAGDPVAGTAKWSLLADDWRAADQVALAAWLRIEALSELHVALNAPGAVERSLREAHRPGFWSDSALAGVKQARSPRVELYFLYTMADMGGTRAEKAKSVRAFELLQREAPESLAMTTNLYTRALRIGRAGEWREEQIEMWKRALELTRAQAPGSFLEASILSRLGQALAPTAFDGRDPERALEYLRGAVAMTREVAPGSFALADRLYSLERIAEQLDLVEDARDARMERLLLVERLTPNSLRITSIIDVERRAALLRGDAAAVARLDDRLRTHLERAVAAAEADSLPPTGEQAILVVRAFARLALMTLHRDAAAEAERLGERALAYADRALAYEEGPLRELLTDRRAQRNLPLLLELADMAMARGEVGEAAAIADRALRHVELAGTDSQDGAWSLEALGDHARDRGDLRGAESLYSRALQAIRRHRMTLSEAETPRAWSAANGLEVNILQGAAFNSMQRGDLARAESLLLSVLEADQTNDKMQVHDRAGAHYHLGVIWEQRGDLDRAIRYHRWALEVYETMPAGFSSNLPVIVLRELSRILADDGSFDEAEVQIANALEHPDNLDPRTRVGFQDRWRALGVRAEIERARGNFERAADLYRELWSFRRGENAQVLAEDAELGHWLGELALEQGRYAEAARYFEALTEPYVERLAVTERGSLFHRMGAAQRGVDSILGAVEYYRRAIDEIESTRKLAGGTAASRGRHAAALAEVYYDLADALLELGEPARAFGVVERAKARALVDMLSERDLTFTADLPEGLRQQRAYFEHEYDAAQAELETIDPTDDDALAAALARRGTARSKLDELAATIRTAAPALAAIEYPEPLDFAAARAALDPGTALLSYLVGEERTIGFVVTPEAGTSEPMTFAVPISSSALQDRIAAFRNQIRRKQGDPESMARLTVAARELYDLLVAPAESAISASERLVVAPDGPLTVLPFAALMREGPLSPQYLTAWKPISTVQSATLLVELRRRRSEEVDLSRATVVAFGDPVYPVSDGDSEPPELESHDPDVLVLQRSGLMLRRLPATRREVDALEALFPATSTVYLGADAIEERVKELGREPDIIHIAVHGILNDDLPLDSALALTIPDPWTPGTPNGLLQAWEIFDHLRIDAELVTLSACDTGLGETLRGEGPMGLTRAFLFAGARTVLASLWQVADESTADLMTSFYAGLKDGLTKDEALRRAQLTLIEQIDYAHPYFWAPFQLSGDWR